MDHALTRVMLLDDHEAVRAALVGLLQGADDLVVCASAPAISGVADLADAAEADVVVIDLHLGGGCGVAVSREIRSRRSETEVVLLTAASEDEALLAALLAGASAVLVKQLIGNDLIRSVRAVAAGSRLDRHELAASLHLALDLDELGERVPLSPRQRVMLPLIVDGLTDRQIAEVLGVDDVTVTADATELISRLQAVQRARSRPFFTSLPALAPLPASSTGRLADR